MRESLNAENILNKIKAEQEKQGRGQLKIFFGYSAGVGKTYAMLKEAQSLYEQGVDVVVGYVEPHQRPDTLALLEGLPKIDLLQVNYKGITLSELDIDAALARRPQIILVDELAHTNANGCRHSKRYQDVEELLRMGINVYTTINVQHVEGLHDVVESITGVAVRERIPDDVFNRADKVELVDIEPEDLIERMLAGKVYKSEQAKRALRNFFTKEKLVALREIALRRTADRVNITVEQNKILEGNTDYFTGEHIMMCLSSSPSNAKVIRTAAKMAAAFHGKFTALFVENSAFADMQEADKARLRDNLRLAEQLGAKIVTVYGEDIPYQMAEYAKVGGVSKIVLGRPAPLRWWQLGKQSYVDKLTSYAPNIETYVIPNKFTSRQAGAKYDKNASSWNFYYVDMLKMLAFIGIATLIGFLFDYWDFSESTIITIYILAGLFTAAIVESRVWGLLSALLSVLTFNFFFTEPRLSLQTYDSSYNVTFLIMFLAAFITNNFMSRVREQAKISANNAYRLEILLKSSQKLQKANNRHELFLEIIKSISELLERKAFIYPVVDKNLGAAVTSDTDRNELQKYLTEQELAVVQWVLTNNKHAGASTNTLAAAQCLYMSIRSGDRVFAVLGIVMADEKFLGAFEKNLFIAMLAQSALALEKYMD